MAEKEFRDSLKQADLDELALHTDRGINSAIQEKGELPSRWKRNEEIWRGEQPGQVSWPFEGAANHRYPFASTKEDALVSNVCGVITANNPYFLGKLHGTKGQRAEEIEDTVHYFYEIARFEEKVRRLALHAALTGKGIYRITYSEQAIDFLADRHDVALMLAASGVAYAGLRIDVIHPANFVLTPALPRGIVNALLQGHRRWATVKEIEELADAGRYISGQAEQVKGGDDPTQSEAGFTQLGSKQSPRQIHKDEDKFAEIYDLLVAYSFDGKPRQLYQVAFAKTAKVVLDVAPYKTYPRPWYFDTFFKLEEGSFWSSTSVAQTLQPLQLEYDALINLIINGSYMQAFPPLVGMAMSFGPGKDLSYSPGESFLSDSPIPPQPILNGFNPAGLYPWVQQLERMADMAVRIPATAAGVPIAGRRSATEAAFMNQGWASGLNEYIQNFGIGLSEGAQFSTLCLAVHFGGQTQNEDGTVTSHGWKPVHGDAVPVVKMEDLLLPVRFELNGKTPSNTPQARLQGSMMFAQLSGANPAFAQITDWPELHRSIARETQLPNSDKFTLADEIIKAKEQKAGGDFFGAAAQNRNGNTQGPVDSVLPDAGMAGMGGDFQAMGAGQGSPASGFGPTGAPDYHGGFSG